ncbi:hypothetical protein N7478_006675 [Penicillium angulare]|uniref:uncharacterized protein n=1 Tax=Penicillium angulare TaxID=116970 RepID=UPI00254062B4|nr:uncharacterized protein N7478_006675 [Penicillium angulare]KAJ5281303.1 hypothetical protein N7478_006675 [Penicillium angulare]
MLSPFRPRLSTLLRRTPKPSSTSTRRLHAFQARAQAQALKPNTYKPLSITPRAKFLSKTTPINHQSQSRAFASKPITADALIEEIQDLYEIAKDEFEIATESTDGGTIYAASDRDAARDALNDLAATYFLYSYREGEEDTGVVLRSGEKMTGSRLLSGEGVVLGEGIEGAEEFKAGYEGEIGDEIKGEVRRRVGQRIRELRNAVELLEERAMEEH